MEKNGWKLSLPGVQTEQCSTSAGAKQSMKKRLWDSIHYDLFKIAFDAGKECFGTPECIYEASQKGKSVSFPRISPDGKYLMFTCSDYGNFSIWHPESELYLLNMETNEIRNMEEVNSNDVESFHTWSSTGEWFVFSSKRQDGLWAHPYIAKFDDKKVQPANLSFYPKKTRIFISTLPRHSTCRNYSQHL